MDIMKHVETCLTFYDLGQSSIRGHPMKKGTTNRRNEVCSNGAEVFGMEIIPCSFERQTVPWR